MTEEHLSEFDGLTPCPAPPRLRASVLAAVDRQLAESDFMLSGATAGSSSSDLPASPCPQSNRTLPGLEKLSAWTVAAALLVGVGLCAWQRSVVDARLAAAFGPPLQSSAITELVRTIESASGPGTGRWLSERLVAFESRRERSHQPDVSITTYPLSTLP
jgi:hypothetical protein